MADNIQVTPGTGATIAAEDVGGGILVQKVKVTVGASGTAVDVVGGSGVVTTGTPRVTLATDVALPVGANILGKVGIDQTTPGTTNLVATNADASIGAGTAPAKSLIAGGVYNSSAPTLTTGQTAALQLDADGSLYGNIRDWTVSSSTVLGKTAIDQTSPGTTNLVATNADGTIGAGTAPAKSHVAGGIYNSSRITLTTGQGSALQLDADGSLYANVCDWTVTNTTLLGRVGVSDGTNAVAIKAASIAAIATDPALVVSVSPNNTPVLPSGAATSAKQPALGTAGSASSDVITVQGVASGTPLTTAAAPATGAMYNGATALTPKFAAVVASASGATTIIAAVTSKKIRVLAVELMANGTVNTKWQSHTTPTDLTGLAYLVVNSGYVLPFSPTGWFETISGEALDINLSASIAVGGSVVYVEV